MSEILNKVSQLLYNNLWKNPVPLNYLIIERGLNASILHKFKVGFDCHNIIYDVSKKNKWFEDVKKVDLVLYGKDYFDGYITFPIFEDNEVVNITGRALGNLDPKHKTIKGFSKTYLYNTNALKSNAVIIVESPIDVITLEQHGFVAVGLLGTNLKATLVPLFGNKKVYLILDNDNSGIMAMNKIAEKLSGIAKEIYIIELPSNGEKVDINSYFSKVKYARDRLRLLIKTAKPFSKIDKVSKIIYEPYIEINVPIVEVGKKLFADRRQKEDRNSLWVQCPHHSNGQEKTNSLWIGGNKNIFTCFGCQVSGGPVKLVSWHLGISYQEAADWIKKNFN